MSKTFYITEIYHPGRNEHLVVMCGDDQLIGEELGRAESSADALGIVRPLAHTGDTLIIAPLGDAPRQVLTLVAQPEPVSADGLQLIDEPVAVVEAETYRMWLSSDAKRPVMQGAA